MSNPYPPGSSLWFVYEWLSSEPNVADNDTIIATPAGLYVVGYDGKVIHATPDVGPAPPQHDPSGEVKRLNWEQAFGQPFGDPISGSLNSTSAARISARDGNDRLASWKALYDSRIVPLPFGGGTGLRIPQPEIGANHLFTVYSDEPGTDELIVTFKGRELPKNAVQVVANLEGSTLILRAVDAD